MKNVLKKSSETEIQYQEYCIIVFICGLMSNECWKMNWD